RAAAVLKRKHRAKRHDIVVAQHRRWGISMLQERSHRLVAADACGRADDLECRVERQASLIERVSVALKPVAPRRRALRTADEGDSPMTKTNQVRGSQSGASQIIGS